MSSGLVCGRNLAKGGVRRMEVKLPPGTQSGGPWPGQGPRALSSTEWGSAEDLNGSKAWSQRSLRDNNVADSGHGHRRSRLAGVLVQLPLRRAMWAWTQGGYLVGKSRDSRARPPWFEFQLCYFPAGVPLTCVPRFLHLWNGALSSCLTGWVLCFPCLHQPSGTLFPLWALAVIAAGVAGMGEKGESVMGVRTTLTTCGGNKCQKNNWSLERKMTKYVEFIICNCKGQQIAKIQSWKTLKNKTRYHLYPLGWL